MENTGKCFVFPQLSYSGPVENRNSAFWVGMKGTQNGVEKGSSMEPKVRQKSVLLPSEC